MSNNALISVIVPVYNVEKYLDKCIESIVNQTYTNLEIILVDDGSPDNCPEMCDEWAKKDSRIKVIHKENGGVSSARNMGIDNCRGQYVAFVDSDDYLDSDMYSVMIEAMIKNTSEIAECSIMRESPNGNMEYWGKREYKTTIIEKRDALIRVNSTLGLVCIHTGNKLFLRELISSFRFDTSLHYNEDALFIYQLLLNCTKIVYVDKPMYHFIYNVSSASHNKNRDYIFDELKVADEILRLSPQELKVYCARGDLLKTFNKIQELLIDESITKSEYSMLRKRVLKHVKLIFSSNIFSKYTKIKTFGICFFPRLFKKVLKIYGKKESERIQKKYVG